MRASRLLLAAALALPALALSDRAHAAPKIDDTMECVLGVFGEPGTTDECTLTVVTDASKAELDKKPHATFRLKIREEATKKELASLAKVPWLEQLEIKGNDGIDDLSVLAPLKKLRRLDIGDVYALKSLAFVKSHPALEVLSLWNVHVDDITPLKGLTKLTKLTLWQDTKDATPISDLTGLTELSATGLDKLGALSKLTKLTLLRASPDDETSLAALAGMTSMKTLRLSGSKKLADLGAIKGMTALESLEIDMTQVSDLSALAGATKLRYLVLNETKVTSLAPLAKLEAIEQVDASHTTIKDFSPLKASAKKMTTLYVPDGTPTSAVAALLKENPKLKVYGLKK